MATPPRARAGIMAAGGRCHAGSIHEARSIE